MFVLAVGIEQVAQLVDLERDRLGATAGQVVAPHVVEEDVGRHGDVGFEREAGENGSLAGTGDPGSFSLEADQAGPSPDPRDFKEKNLV